MGLLTDAEPKRRFAPRRRKAFVVDDDAATLLLLSDLLEDAGWEVRLFADVRSVRQALTRSLPDLLVLDDDLPDGKGGDLAGELRCQARTRHLRILFCTASSAERRQRLSALGNVLAKPFELAALEQRLEHAAYAPDDSIAS